jgi:NAD+ diphosphatase
MSEIRTAFSDVGVDRCTTMRGDAGALAKALKHASTRFLPVSLDHCLIRDGRAALLSHDSVAACRDQPSVFLGRLDNRYLFAVSVSEITAGELITEGQFAGLRELASVIPEHDAALLAYARAMIGWQNNHLFCGVCGRPNRATEGGFVMVCSATDCSHRSFPRLDPAIIVLVKQNESCLLGRQKSWPEGRFSTIAGFVEPGESLENAVRREVLEETNIQIGRCQYMASQPWPFPSALMLGFHAEGRSTSIHLNDHELAEARWLTRSDIARRKVTLPPRTSVAYRLIEAWFNEEPGRHTFADLSPGR